MSRLALITPDTDFEARVRATAHLADEEVRRWWDGAAAPARLVAELAASGTEVACVGPSVPPELVFEVAAACDRDHPEIVVVAVVDPGPDAWERAVRSGVRDLLAPASGPAELAAALQRATGTAARRRANLAGEGAVSTRMSRVAVVLSPKGGVGKTTVASNLSVGLAAALPGRVAAADLDLQFGDLATALQLTPEHTVADVVRLGEVDATSLKLVLTPHPSGLYVLCAPDTPEHAEDVTHEHTSAAVDVLAAGFDVVVLDTGAGLDEHTLAAVERATDLVLLASMDVASVRAVRKELDTLEQLGLGAARRHLVLNRAETRVGLTAAVIEDVVGMPVDIAIPSSRDVVVSLNEGTTMVERNRRSPVSRQIVRLVDRLADGLVAPSPQPLAGAAAGGSASEGRRRWGSR